MVIRQEAERRPTDVATKERRPPHKILVISDTHFGEGDAILAADPQEAERANARIDGLMAWLADEGPFREIILLGDIWELWSANFQAAREASELFLSQLGQLPFERMIFLPGNHDHHLLVQHQLVEQIMALRGDREIEVPAYTQRSFNDSYLARLFPPDVGPRFTVSYPDHFATVADRQIIFHHGHHAGVLQGRSVFSSGPLFILRRLENIGLADISRSDLELASTIIFEFMYAASLGEQTRTKLNRFWDNFLRAKRILMAAQFVLLAPLRLFLNRTTRGTTSQDVERFAGAIERLLAMMAAERHAPVPCDAYIFGHTHRAGIVRHSHPDRARPMLLVNSGSWLHEPAKRNRASEGTFLIIDEHSVTLYRQNLDLSIRPLDIEPWPA